jgi:hypothetical protein
MLRRAPIGILGYLIATSVSLSVSMPNSAAAAGPFDGTYGGTLSLEMGNPQCAQAAHVQMTVTDSKLEYHHFSNATIIATVGPDGSFSGSGPNLRYRPPVSQSLTGTIAAGKIEAVTEASGCRYHLSLKRL